MIQAGKEYHFEKSSSDGGASAHDDLAREFAGRRPWGLDAKGADEDCVPLAFDHGIRRSPAEKLVSKGYSVSPRPVRGEELGPERCAGAYRYRTARSGGVRLLSYEGDTPCVDIPARLDGVEVVSLATNLFRGHGEIEAVSMPDSIEHAGNHVFDGCENLKRVRLSASLSEVNPTMFLGCSSLAEVELSHPSVHLEGNSFSEAPVECIAFGPRVRTLDALPSSLPHLKRIRVDAENECFATDGKALVSKDGSLFYRLVVSCGSYAVPECCTAIAEHAFDSHAKLDTIVLPRSLERIGRMAFAKTGLTEVRFPAALVSIGEKAFFHCAKLLSADLPSGLKGIGTEAFAFTGLLAACLPHTLEELGHRAFDHTPAQARVGEGALRIAHENGRLSLDDAGGLYREDTFVELIGQVEHYRVRNGTRMIADGAFKRHAKVREVVVCEGVVSIGREAFRGDRHLVRVELPESLERIGEGAFLDTSLATLRLSKNVRFIGDDALLVQGGNQLMPRSPLASLDLDPENPEFYVENGLLCRRGGGRLSGDACILYVGPDAVVRIPERVTHIANLAFCGADGIDELYVHGHLHSICAGAFSTARTIPLVHVRFPEPIDGCESADFFVPDLSARYRSPSYLFEAGPAGTVFDFEYYDSWVSHTSDMGQFAPAALGRLMNPIRLSEHMREIYCNIFARKPRQACRVFADKGDIQALAWLSAHGLLDASAVEAELDASSHEGRTQATACLLELKHRFMPSTGVDFSL
ncbi:leucine-rich repeat domain-containing protein [Raoultibacter phocaeensis]|uniref:leucine-rich repeat domain-containing protein n=1 Tax=Raoultibacter phocaeensis TaxID=2479841 RepID=UPI001118C98C|nr:leucine-rich repeat domain-containing protein [Raoultibacter phocaeensis]